jgi:uncharacterized protein (TIGR02996 family)
MTVSKEEIFLRRILRRPDDDRPRLDYAQWLERQADPRGEFIRVQCELARTEEDDPRRVPLESRQAALLEEFAELWTTPLKELHVEAEDVTFVRGMVEEIRIEAFWAFLRTGKELFEAAPLLRDATFDNGLGDACGVGDRLNVERLAACPYLARLTSLALDHCRIETAGAGLLASSHHVAGLMNLSLSSADIGPEGARALAGSPYLRRLEHLFLYSNHVGDEGAVALASSSHLKRLESVVLINEGISEAAEAALEKRFEYCCVYDKEESEDDE